MTMRATRDKLELSNYVEVGPDVDTRSVLFALNRVWILDRVWTPYGSMLDCFGATLANVLLFW
jgi:hypothetical protein